MMIFDCVKSGNQWWLVQYTKGNNRLEWLAPYENRASCEKALNGVIKELPLHTYSVGSAIYEMHKDAQVQGKRLLQVERQSKEKWYAGLFSPDEIIDILICEKDELITIIEKHIFGYERAPFNIHGFWRDSFALTSIGVRDGFVLALRLYA